MRLLLDECVPRKLKHELPGHEVSTVPQMGWAGIKNGPLLRRAAGRFDVMITTDQNVEHQQNLPELGLAVLVLIALRNDIDLLRPLMPRAREALGSLRAGDLLTIGL